MKILVDADSCRVLRKIEKLAKERNIPVFLFSDYNHDLHSNYSQIITVQEGSDSTDYAVFNMCNSGDLVVTQDAGLASMVLLKGAKVIHPCGKVYSEENIDMVLNLRHLNSLARETRRIHKKKRTSASRKTYNFESAFINLLCCQQTVCAV